jgi:prepilin-type processing-associated H-X9-DG protein
MGTEPQEKESWQDTVVRPGNGRLILGLGIAAIVADISGLLCLLVPLPLGLGLGIAAAVTGQRDLGRMRRGEMEASDKAATKLGRTLGIISIFLAVAVGYTLVVWMDQGEHRTGTTVCLSNEQQLFDVLKMYAGDYNGHLPQAAGWAPVLATSYLKNLRTLKCWEERGNTRSSYGMNAALSGKKLADLANPAEVVLLYETARPGTSPYGGVEDVIHPGRHIPAEFFSSAKGNVFAFADGHVKWIKDGEAMNFVPKWKKAAVGSQQSAVGQ